MNRPFCQLCSINQVAINCIVKEKRYYRKICESCIRKGKKIKPVPPQWYKSGYRKKSICERCGFRAKFPEKQMAVFHLDGNLKNITMTNLKSICLNCCIEIEHSNTTWKPATLTPDF